MTFKPDLNSFNKIKSGAGAAGYGYLGDINEKHGRALMRTMFWNDKKEEAAKYDAQIAAQMAFPAAADPGTDWMGIANTVKDSGILNGLFNSGMDTNSLVARDNAMYGNSFPDGSFGIGSTSSDVATRHLDTGNSWWNPFGWGK
jgi:hypothetical protein